MFEIWPAKGGGYFWVYKAANGQTLCHSEVYTTRQSAYVGINSLKAGGSNAPVYER